MNVKLVRQDKDKECDSPNFEKSIINTVLSALKIITYEKQTFF